LFEHLFEFVAKLSFLGDVVILDFLIAKGLDLGEVVIDEDFLFVLTEVDWFFYAKIHYC